jgi:hypothetical protein
MGAFMGRTEEAGKLAGDFEIGDWRLEIADYGRIWDC